ncbi:MAG: 4Fe-4S binding protein [Eubacteriaceae bacterium]|nr:4Fe-4S binding protein [Eubacteriaceae bacterium]
MSKNVSLIYFSPTGTTAKILKAISEGMEEESKTYDFTLPNSRKETLPSFTPDDLVIFGAPVYAGRIPELAASYFSQIKGNGALAVFIVLFGNRDYDDALLELKNILEEQGFKGIAAGAFVGEHSFTPKVGTGRPDQDDLSKAKDFGKRLSSWLKAIESSGNLTVLQVKGNFPYKKGMPPMNIGPVTNEDCIECALCAQACPTEAVSFDNFRDIETDKCIRCCSCIKICPVDAKSFPQEPLVKITAQLENNFSLLRKEVETIIAENLDA